MRPGVVTVLFAASACVSQCVLAADVPICSRAQRNGLHVDTLETEQHRLFEVPVVDYPPTDRPEFEYHPEFDLRVDERGHVVCFMESRGEGWPPLTPEQRAVLHRASSWRYQPFLRGGRPTAVIASQRFHEQILPQRHVPTPRVPDDQVRVTLVQGQHFFGGKAYAVHIRGDGWVGFHAMAGSDVSGTFAYRVPRKDVARLVRLIRDGDLWSAAGNYRGKVTDQATRWLTVQFGNETRKITDYAGRAIGMPAIVTRVQEEAARVARADQWTTLSHAALDRLQRDGFDFKSRAAGEMLVRAVLDRRARDDRPMLRLLTLGAPIDAPLRGNYALNRPDPGSSLIEQALLLRRTRLIAPLIERGALDTNGRPDQRKIDAAFRAAVAGGRLEPLKRVWAVAGSRPHPALTYRDEPEFPKAPPKDGVPVALLLSRDYGDPDWEGLEIARWLAAQGNDLNAMGADGRTLLEAATKGDDARFVRYLLDHGADPTATGRYDYSPLGSAFSEDVALALLAAGSELPRQFTGYRTEAEERGWNRVVAWLDAHPSAPIMPLTESEREDAARQKRVHEEVRTSPCWQRWIAEQARAIRAAKEKGARRAESIPMYCMRDCGESKAGSAKATRDAKVAVKARAQSCGAGQG